MIFLLIVVFAGITWYEVPGLIRQKHSRSLMLFSILMAFAFVLSFLLVIGIRIPSLERFIHIQILKELLHLNYK
jgi:ABC-type uncharacterized transport system permease subunit